VTQTFSQLSNHFVMGAMVVYFLALVAHIAEWAQARELTAEPESARAVDHERMALREQVAIPARGAVATAGEPERAGVGAGLDAEANVARFGRIGLSLTVLAAALHVVGDVCRGIAAGRVPWGNMYEFAVTGSLAVVLAYFVLVARYRVRWLGLPVTAFATLILGLAVTVLYRPISPLVPALHSYWLMVHVSAAAIAGGAYTVGALASVLYLVKSRAERRAAADPAGPRVGYLWRLPSAQGIDRIAYRVHAFAFPLWTFAVMAGAIWAEYAWGRYWGWDPKETWAFITWVAYAAYLHARATAGWQGRAAAYVALLGYSTFLFNFIGINLFGSGLHSYSGM
jgi:cytochrome c-type biogenesis protein CcsB